MKTEEIKGKVSGNLNGTLAELMAQLVKDAEKIVQDTGQEVRQELAAEIAIITDQYEKKKKQIMEKARKNASDRATRVTENIREAFTNEIEQASTNTISEAIEKANHRLEDLVKLPSAVVAKVVKEASADKIHVEEAGISQKEGKNIAEAEDAGKPAKDDNKDEIAISTISIEDEAEPKQDFVGWLQE